MNLKPFYEIDGVTIYHGDARDVLPCITADVLVCDPPYGMAYTSGWSGCSVIGDSDTVVRDDVLALWGGPALVFGRWSEPKPKGVRARLVWDKGEWPGMGDLTLPWGPSDEEIYVIGDGFLGKRSGTVLRCRRLPAHAMTHPTEKPAELIEMLLQKCPPGVVVDPFAGSGAILDAARASGRKAVGIEIEEAHCATAARRLSQGVLRFA